MRASTRGRRLRSTPRPRDRRDQLATIAADLFRRNGYHNVSVNDIASAAGITGPAVYRHFPSKQAILGHVVLGGLDRFASVIHAAVQASDPDDDQLRVLAESVSRVVVERRDLGALWRREGRNLPPEDRAELAARARRATRFGVHLVRRSRPSLPEADADLLCWAALSVWGSVSEHQVSLPRARLERLLTTLALAVAATTLPTTSTPTVSDEPSASPAGAPSGSGGAAGGSGTAGGSGGFGEPSAGSGEPSGGSGGAAGGYAGGYGGTGRREQLLGLAARMFCEDGFHAVTMEGIGSAAGISGPSIYRHYASKADLLMAMCARVRERLRAGAEAAHRVPSPAQALGTLVVSFVDTVLDNRDLVAAYLMEGDSLPDRDRSELRRLQRDYLAEWVAVLTSVTAMDDKSARVRVHAAFAVVNDLARTHRFAGRPALPAELVTLATAVLLARE